MDYFLSSLVDFLSVILLFIFYLLRCFKFSMLCIFPADTTLNPSSYSLLGCRAPKCRRCFPFYWGRVCIICLLFLPCIVGFIKARIVPVRLFKNLFIILIFYIFSSLPSFLPVSPKLPSFLSAYSSLVAAMIFCSPDIHCLLPKSEVPSLLHLPIFPFSLSKPGPPCTVEVSPGSCWCLVMVCEPSAVVHTDN